ncbi:hypothetical protein [Limibacterium fermenti]|uniref:hypothetical protein n=1 Tax=Limibacterium fermenti TaxID=3229863 RepID=UPI003A616A33
MEMITGKYCFVQFNEGLTECEMPLPVKNLNDLRFFIDNSITELNVDIVGLNGEMIREFVHSFNYFSTGLDLSGILTAEDCFRLKLTDKTAGKVYYSNVLVYLPETEYLHLSYWCDKDEFGFHYEANKPNTVRIPAILRKPSYVENAEKYTDSNGKTRVLYKEIQKKYALQTDYMPYSWHDKLKIALSHDLVKINDTEMDETGNYTLGDEINESACGVECVMGETEVAENFTERNTNC